MTEEQNTTATGRILVRHRSGIVAAWADALRDLPGSHYHLRTPEELRDWSAASFDAVVDRLVTGSGARLEAHVEMLGRVRRQLGFEVGEVVEGVLLLQPAVRGVLRASDAVPPAEIALVDEQLSATLRRYAHRFASEFAAGMRLSLEEERSRSERVAVLEERQKLARELHDSVTQSIYGVSMYAEAAHRMLETGDGAGAASILGEIRDTALDALREMRLLIYELRPRAVAKDGLAAAIEARLTAVERRSGLVTEFETGEIGPVPRELAEAIHGIAREALNNVLKHARASRILVRLGPCDEGLRLEIEDDGVGFEIEEVRRSGGLGLAGMEERAAALGGRVTIRSGPGGGTRVRLTAPRAVDEGGAR